MTAALVNVEQAKDVARAVLKNVKRAVEGGRIVHQATLEALYHRMISFKINPETLNVSIHGTLDPSKMAEVLNRALVGDPDAGMVIDREIADLNQRGREIDPALDEAQRSRKRTRVGRIGKTQLRRDWLIAQAVEKVMKLGFNRIRGKEQRGVPSACSIVRDVLSEQCVNMSESAVNSISDKWSRFVSPTA